MPKSTIFVKYEGEVLDPWVTATKKLHRSHEERSAASKDGNYLDPEYFQVSTYSIPEAFRRSQEVSSFIERSF